MFQVMPLENTMPMLASSASPRRKSSNETNTALGDRRVRRSSRRNAQQLSWQSEGPLQAPNVLAVRDGSGRKARKTDRPSRITRYEDEEAQEPKIRTRKLYQRKKVFRKWVLLALFLVPLGIIWLEYYIGKLIGLEDIKDTYQEQMYDPWDLLRDDFNASRIREKGSISPLPLLAYAPRMQCPSGQRRMLNVHNPVSHSFRSRGRLIPTIVHQQSKTRCLTMKVDQTTIKWAMKQVRITKAILQNPFILVNLIQANIPLHNSFAIIKWSYYMHDEISQNKLFNEYCGGETPTCEFPLLNQIVSKCLQNLDDDQNQHRYYSSKAELWKFLAVSHTIGTRWALSGGLVSSIWLDVRKK